LGTRPTMTILEGGFWSVLTGKLREEKIEEN